MRARLVATAFLLVIAVALSLAATMKRGPPWGYRGHAAVILETTGAVEATASEAKRTAAGGADVVMKLTPGTFLDAGDEVRACRYCEARLRTPAADVIVGDDARVVLGDHKGLKVLRGLVEIVLPRSTSPFEVTLQHDGKLILRAGPDGGSFRIVSDGRSEARVFVRMGSAEAAAAGDAHAESGQVLVIDDTRVPRIEPARPFAPVVTCDNKLLTIDVPGATQVIALRELRYPDKGRVTFELKEVRPAVPVLARDVNGRAWRAAVPCAAAKK